LYSSTKSSIETLTRAWAAEFPRRRARQRHLTRRNPRPHPRQNQQRRPLGRADDTRHPSGRCRHPDAIAHAAVYLASDESAFVHGAVIDVDGGRANIAAMAT
jgi:NAD(P)-dependent dehydrogenase (short-subunit alcohol dehydrogenase family)